MREHTKEWEGIINKAERVFSYWNSKISIHTQGIIGWALKKETTGVGGNSTDETNSLLYKLTSNYTNPQVSDKEIFEFRLNNFKNIEDPRYEAYTCIQYLIRNREKGESLKDIFYKFLDEVKYVLPEFDDVNIEVALKLKKPEKGLLSHVEVLLRLIYMFIQLEYYCYCLEILSEQIISKQKYLSIKDAFAYSIITNIKLTKGLYSYTEEGYTVMKTQLLHLACLLDIVKDTHNYEVSDHFKKVTKIIVQPIVFDKFRFVNWKKILYINEEDQKYVDRYSQVFYYSEEELLNSPETFIYKTFKDTIGMHSLWYKALSSTLCEIFSMKFIGNLLSASNLITTTEPNRHKGRKPSKNLSDNYYVFSLAFINSMDSLMSISSLNYSTKAYITLESCRLLTEKVYNFYYKFYGYRGGKDYTYYNIESPVKRQLARDTTTHTFDTLAYCLGSFKLNSNYIDLYIDGDISEEKFRSINLNKLVNRIWLEDVNKNSQYYLHLSNSEWRYDQLSKFVENILLKIIWTSYKNKYPKIDCANVYYEYIYNDDRNISLDTDEDSFFMKIITLYLLSIPDRQYRDDREIQTRYMEMSLGL